MGARDGLTSGHSSKTPGEPRKLRAVRLAPSPPTAPPGEDSSAGQRLTAPLVPGSGSAPSRREAQPGSGPGQDPSL